MLRTARFLTLMLLSVGTLRGRLRLSGCWPSIHGQFFHADFLAFLERIRRIEYDPILNIETLQNLETRTIITADRNLPQVDFVIGIHDHRAQPFRTEQQGVHGNLEPSAAYLDL